MFMYLILFTLSIVEAKDHSDSSKDFFPYFNTKTAYEFVHGKMTIPKSDCKPIQIWMLIRHGTRYPKSKQLPTFLNLPKLKDEILQNHKNQAGRLNSKDLEKLRNWKLDRNINEAMCAHLTPGAEKDIRSLANRIQKVYPELLETNPKNIKPTDYIFRATNTPRTQGTLNFFFNTLFGNTKIITPMQSLAKDTLLTPYKYSSEWKSGYEAKHSKDEQKKFENGTEIKILLTSISKRLGYSHMIEFGKVNTMHNICGFETAWFLKKSSIWCKLFTNNELKLLEFYNDLSSYYRVGPGREMSSKFGCVLLKDMFKYFKDMEKGQSADKPKGIFYFAHASTIQVLLSTLKIGKEPKLLATSYDSAANRNYRTSLLVPFTTNVIATFYKCSGKISTFKVMFHTAEKVTPIAGCPDGFCDWENLKKEFKSTVEQCEI